MGYATAAWYRPHHPNHVDDLGPDVAVRSKRLWPPTVITGTAVTLYTGPASETSLLKELWAANSGPLTATIRLFLNTGAGDLWVFAFTVPSNGGARVGGLFVVLQPGDVLKADATANTLSLVGFGAQLEGVAD